MPRLKSWILLCFKVYVLRVVQNRTQMVGFVCCVTHIKTFLAKIVSASGTIRIAKLK